MFYPLCIVKNYCMVVIRIVNYTLKIQNPKNKLIGSQNNVMAPILTREYFKSAGDYKDYTTKSYDVASKV